MAYCTYGDILRLISEAELAELTTESGETPDRDMVEEVIAQADALIDGYLEPRYGAVMPLTDVPEIVRALSADIALYHLYSRRNLIPEARRYKYEDAVTFLKQVAAGRANIPGLSAYNPERTATLRCYAI